MDPPPSAQFVHAVRGNIGWWKWSNPLRGFILQLSCGDSGSLQTPSFGDQKLKTDDFLQLRGQGFYSNCTIGQDQLPSWCAWNSVCLHRQPMPVAGRRRVFSGGDSEAQTTITRFIGWVLGRRGRVATRDNQSGVIVWRRPLPPSEPADRLRVAFRQ